MYFFAECVTGNGCKTRLDGLLFRNWAASYSDANMLPGLISAVAPPGGHRATLTLFSPMQRGMVSAKIGRILPLRENTTNPAYHT